MTKSTEISEEQLEQLFAEYDRRGGDRRMQELREEQRQRYLAEIEPARQKVIAYLQNINQASEENLNRLEAVTQELQAREGLNNFHQRLPDPATKGYRKVNHGKVRLRKSWMSEIGVPGSLEQPDDLLDESPERKGQPNWQTLLDIQGAVKDLGLQSRITRLWQFHHAAETAGKWSPLSAFDLPGIPVVMLLAVRKYPLQALTT